MSIIVPGGFMYTSTTIKRAQRRGQQIRSSGPRPVEKKIAL